jgi:hypothetical protein
MCSDFYVDICSAEDAEQGEVHRFDDGASEVTLVEFGNGGRWFGAFAQGNEPDWNDVAVFPKGWHALVIAGGQGYVVNAAERKIVRRTAQRNLRDAAYAEGRDYALAADKERLYLIGVNEDLGQTEKFADQGIEIVHADHWAVRGVAHLADGQNSGHEFQVSLRDLAVEVVSESISERVERFTRELFAPIAGERLDDLMARVTHAKKDAIEEHIMSAYGLGPAQEIAFHLTDWSREAAFLVALLLHPNQYSEIEVQWGIQQFLIHAPNHIAAAAKVSGWGIQDVWGLGELVFDDPDAVLVRLPRKSRNG